MIRAKKKRRSLKSAIALLLAGVMLVGQAHGIGAAGASTVQAAEETTIEVTSMAYYDPGQATVTATGIDDASFGIIAPLINGKPYQELNLSQVWDDIAVEAKQENGSWTNVDQSVNPDSIYKWNVDWGFNLGENWDNYVFWFKLDKTTDIRVRSISHPDIFLEYHLEFNQLTKQTITSISTTEISQNATATGESSIHFDQMTVNGKKLTQFVEYQQIEGDLEMLVDNKDGKGFVALSANPDSGFMWGQNFGMWYEGAGGIWFKGVFNSFTVRFQSKSNPSAVCEFNVNYSEPVRTNYTLSTTGPGDAIVTSLDANAAQDNAASVGIVLPYIGGQSVYQMDLEKFVYEIQTDNGWVNLANAEGWVYQGNGYSKYSDKQQWGYFGDYVWGLWFQPVLKDLVLRVGYPENGEKGGAINNNYITYTIKGNPNGKVPDVADMVDIEVDTSTAEPTNDNVQISDITVPEGWEMIWNDEFNGNSLNSNNWANQTGFILIPDDITTAGWGNNELEHYTDSAKNTSVGEGKLKLTMLPDEKDFYSTDGQKATAKYSSGKILTKDKFSVKYGRVDFRAKMPAGTGIWPAMWMMPNDDIYGTWAASGEIDVFEGKGRLPNEVYGTLHYGNMSPGNKNTGDFIDIVENGNIKSDFTNWHVYSLVWEEGNIKIYVDGKCYFKCTNEIYYSGGAGGNVNAPFDQRFYLIINLAAGGWFDGGTVPGPDFEKAEMFVDYVRVYQKPVGEDEDEKPDSEELEESGKTKHASVGKDDNLYGDYSIGVQIPLEKMTLDKTSITIPAGVAEVITPSFVPENATNKNVTWTSSNEAVATVSGGIVKGIAPGTATITAVSQDGNITKTCAVTVTGDEVVMIEVNPETLELEAGQKSKLTATVSTELSNQNVTWSSSNTSIATVDQNGNVTAVAEGTATITAQTEGGTIYSDTCEVTVTPKAPVSVTGVTIKKGTDESGEVSIEAGSTVSLTASVAPSDATNKNVTWTTGDSTIATVTNGTVTGVKEGTTTVTVKTEDGNYTDTWNVIVTKKSAERTDYGVERNGDDITFYYKGSAAVAFSTMLDSADQTIDETQVPGYGPVQNGEYYEYTIVDGAAGNEDKYLAYWFNVTYMDKKIIKVSDIPVVDDGSGETTVAVTGVTLNNTTLTMVKDETATLRATVEPLTATNRNVTWESSDDSIVSVDGGKLTAKKAGTATITVTTEDGKKTATCKVTVGNSYTVQFKDGDTVIDTQIVQENGTVTAPADPEKAGHTFAGWVYNNATYNFSSPVTGDMVIEADWNQIMVERIQMSENITLEEGSSSSITPTIRPTDAYDKSVKWSSDNKSVATVDENTGVITAVAAGTAKITATANDGSGVTATCTVTVTEKTVEKALYTVDFMVDGTSIKSIKVEEGSVIATADIPADPTKDGYTFDGWYDGNTEFDFNSAVTKSTQLVAKFTKDKVTVTDVTLNKTEVTLEKGASETLSATVNPSDADDKSVTWKSDNPSVATVVNGVVTAVAAGEATITVTTNDGSHTATCKVTVTEETDEPVAVSGVVLDETEVSIVEGETATLVATVNPSNADDKSVTWKSDNPSVATVVNGVVTAVAAGETTITVTTNDGSHTASCKIIVTAKAPETIPVKGVTLNKATVTLKAGKSETLVATVNPSNADDTTVTWSSSDPSVATVVNGVVIALAKGETTITVTTNDGSHTATCKVTVTEENTDNPDVPDEILVSDIVMSETTKTIKVGEKVTLTATAYPENADNKSITWSSDNTKVATVENGVVTAKAAGTAKIYAIAMDGSGKSGFCEVTVQAAGSTTPDTPNTPDVPNTPVTKTYTVAFNSEGGTAVAGQTVKENGTVTQPANPTRAGYTFAGWYNGNVLYNFNTPVKNNLTLTASWTVNKVSSIKITGMSKKIAVNKKIKLTATVNDDALDKSVTWSVDKPKYASVDKNGVVKMKKAGKNKTVKVTATANDGSGVSSTYSIKIMQYAVKKITLVGSKTVKVGKKVKLKAIISPIVSKKKINKDLQWTSSNEEWATVTKKGVVKTKKAGKGKTVKITAKALDGSNKKKTIKIKIK